MGEKNPNYGKHPSTETRMKMSMARIGNQNAKGKHIGKHWFNNGVVNVFQMGCPEGFVRGRLKKRTNGMTEV